jgi:hypothetical protein
MVGMSSKEMVGFNFGEKAKEGLELLTKMPWFSKEECVRPACRLSREYWDKRIVKDDDENLFGNKRAFFIND